MECPLSLNWRLEIHLFQNLKLIAAPRSLPFSENHKIQRLVISVSGNNNC